MSPPIRLVAGLSEPIEKNKAREASAYRCRHAPMRQAEEMECQQPPASLRRTGFFVRPSVQPASRRPIYMLATAVALSAPSPITPMPHRKPFAGAGRRFAKHGGASAVAVGADRQNGHQQRGLCRRAISPRPPNRIPHVLGSLLLRLFDPNH